MGGLILGADAQPLVPPSISAALADIDPRLGLLYHPALRAFCVTLRWPEDDPRREMIRRGDIDPNSDAELLCPVPAEVSLDDLHGWIRRQLVRVGQSREDVRRMIAANETRVAAQHAQVLEDKLTEARETLAASASAKTINVGARRTRVK